MPRHRNVILIITDDMGYADLDAFGDSDIATPHMDRLVARGMALRDGYVTAPICTPSRMAIMTGRYHQRCGFYDLYHAFSAEARAEYSLFEQERTMADYFHDAGYRTGLVGKWHLGLINTGKVNNAGRPHGDEPFCHPCDKGFDEFVGIPGGMSSYFAGAHLFRNRDREPFAAPEYLTDYFGTEAVDFIDRNRSDPFFLTLAFNAVHAPLDAVDEDLLALGEFPSPDRKTYAAMLTAMDRNVGRVLDAVDHAGIAEDTVIVFINDNGGGGNHTQPHTRNTGRNAPLRGFKFDVFEGGVRVPFIISAPGRIPAGQDDRRMVCGFDILPTCLAAAGIEAPADAGFDGVDLLPYLDGSREDNPHERLCWSNRRWDGPRHAQGPQTGRYNHAIRQGRWKLVCCDQPTVPDEGAEWYLYDLERDLGEQHDLAAEHPPLVAELVSAWRSWRAEMAEPVRA